MSDVAGLCGTGIQMVGGATGAKTGAAEKDVITIKGTEGLLVRMASCCKPIPGDAVVGVMATGNGMEIHSDTCPRLLQIDKGAEVTGTSNGDGR